MKPRDDDLERDERALRTLFEATSEAPSQQTLERLARHAAQVPDARAPGLFVRWRRAWGMGLAAALAFGALVWVSSDDPQPSPQADTSANTTAPATAERPPSPVPDREEGEVLAWLELLDAPDEGPEIGDPTAPFDVDLLSALDVGRASGDPLTALDLLQGPPEGADLVAWGQLYDALLDEDG